LKKLLRYSNNSGEAAVNYLYPDAGKQTDVSNALYHLVWQPLQPLLSAVHTVYYSPSGLLWKLSYTALQTGDGKLLAEEYKLKQLLCTRSIVLPAESRSNFADAALWGGVDYNKTEDPARPHSTQSDSTNSSLGDPVHDLRELNKNYSGRTWPSLPGTKTETGNIFLLLNEKKITCKLESESAANEEQFKKMDGNSPSLLHIATHGFFLPSTTLLKTGDDYSVERNSFSLQQSPMFRSGLLLAGANLTWTGKTTHQNAEDGVLTAYEISHLDLSNTQLVTLSACETALGEIEDNEGVYGLQRAFIMAGAKKVLMSLWTVPDKEATELMLRFYNSLLQGNDANKALHTAQLAMKEKYSPYYWAGFVLTE
jgi:CHAT domain-containing protein